MSRIFKFDTLITPSIVRFLFYFGVVVSVIAALGILGTGLKLMDYQFMLGLSYMIGGVLVTVIGIIVSRVIAEMILVLFMIRDELAWQRQTVQAGGQVHSVSASAAE
jgi:hypothetical protein